MADINQITPVEANAILEGDEDSVYLDVRTVEEFEAGHPAGAVNIPVLFFGAGGPKSNPDFLAVAEKTIPKEKRILCGCKSGGRSQVAAQALVAAGYEKVENVAGGFSGSRDKSGNTVVAGWQESGLPMGRGEPAGATYAALKERAGH